MPMAPLNSFSSCNIADAAVLKVFPLAREAAVLRLRSDECPNAGLAPEACGPVMPAKAWLQRHRPHNRDELWPVTITSQAAKAV